MLTAEFPADADAIVDLYRARDALHDAHLSGDSALIAEKARAYMDAEQRRRDLLLAGQ